MADGRLEVITGPMYSGKTSELIRRINRAEVADKKVKCFKPVLDDRYEEKKIGSHDGDSVEALLVEESTQITSHVNESDDVIVVDEVNFFKSNLVPSLQSLAYQGHRVIAAGTDQTFRGTPFHPVDGLMAVADRVEKLQAVCQSCGDDASMNQRLDQTGEPASVDEPTVKVGGDDIYEARCRDCHEVKTHD
jgi:Thymidine kinase